ncbi:helix-turn-helix domain-containing protein [Nesterenkonia halobia]
MNTHEQRPAQAAHDEYLTADEVAKLLKIPRSTLSWWRQKRTGPRFAHVGRHVRYLASDVQAYCEAAIVPTSDTRPK